MRKVYSTMLLALIFMLGSAVSASADSLSFKVKTDPAMYAQEMEFAIMDENYDDVGTFDYDETEGVWTITIDDYDSELMYAVYFMYEGDDTAITGVLDQDGEDAFDTYNFMWEEAPYVIYAMIFDDSWNDAEFTFQISQMTTDATVTINVDHADLVELVDAAWKQIELVDGENVLDFISAMQFPLKVMNATGEIDPWAEGDEEENLGIYKVTINGEPVQQSYGSWTLNVEDGDVVDIITEWPDVDYTVTVNIPEGCENVVSSFMVNGEEVENVSFAEPLTYHVGTKLAFMFNTNDYKLNTVKVNDAEKWVYRTLEVQVVDNMVVDIDCTKYEDFSVTVTNNNPDIINVYTGSSTYYKENIIDFSEGNTKEVTLTSGDPSMCWEVNAENEGNYLITATLNGEELNGTHAYDVKEGDVLVVTANEIIRDEVLVIFLPDFLEYNAAVEEDGYLGSSTGLSIQNADYNKLQGLHEGYNLIPFLQSIDSPLRYIQQYPSKPDSEDMYDYIFKVYLNDVEVEYPIWGGYVENLNVKDGDVLKIYQLGTVEEYKLDITADETIEDNEINVTKDIVIPVFNWKEGVQSYRDTQVNIEIVPEEGYEYGVKVDGEDLQPTEGVYKIVLDANKKAEISKTSGVLNILGENGKSDIYNAQGIRVLTNATKADLNNLPKGIYIINGVKVIK